MPSRRRAEACALTFDLDVDICVVGAGLAGLTVALEAARLGASVAVLEGRHVGWNASGHQLGTVMPGYGLAIDDLIARVGFESTRELWSLSKEGAEFVRANATEALIPGIAMSEGALEVSNVDAGDRLIGRLQMLGEDFGTEVEGWQIDRVRGVLRTERYFHAVVSQGLSDRRSQYLHTWRPWPNRRGATVRGHAGGRIDPSGIRNGSSRRRRGLRASHIVLAGQCSATAAAVGDAAAGVALCRRHRAAWRSARRSSRFLARSSTTTVSTISVVNGDRLMVGPETTWEARPQRFAGAIRAHQHHLPGTREVDIAEVWGG